MKERLRKTLVKYATVLAVGVGYLILFLCTGIGLPCIFYEVTGLQCPACGVSRMLISLLRLDVVAAFRYNPFLLVNGPVIVGCLVYSDVQYVRLGHRKHPRAWDVILWCEIGLALLFGIWRNFFA